MEVSTQQILFQVNHLLENLETPDPEIKKTIENLTQRTNGLIHLCLVGHESAAIVGLEMLRPEINELVINIGQSGNLISSKDEDQG